MQPDFSRAFIDGRTIETEDETVIFKMQQVCDLVVPTGFIVACDPFVFFDSVPFTTQIPVGTYPVILSIACFDNDQRVAYARLQISNEPTVRWEMALIPNQDINSLKTNEIFGYPVDAGTGCFMDAEASTVFLKKLEDEVWTDENSYSDFMIKEMEKNYVHTWDWGNFKLDESVGNIVTFKSGLGDGVYASYFGFDANDKITNLVTDFTVIEDTEVYSKEQRDIDLIIEKVNQQFPEILVHQYQKTHPADDDGVWWFSLPTIEPDIKLDSPYGFCPFMVETNEHCYGRNQRALRRKS
jgi:hypothetical protein